MVRVHVDGEYGCGGVVGETIIIAYRGVEHILLLCVTHRHRKIRQFFRDDETETAPSDSEADSDFPPRAHPNIYRHQKHPHFASAFPVASE